MKVNTISIGYERKFNLGNFEAATISVHMWASVDEDEDPDAVVAFCFEQAKQHVKSNVPPKYQPFPATVKTKTTISGMEVENDGSY